MKTAAKNLTMKTLSLVSLFGAMTVMAVTPLWSAARQDGETPEAAPTEVDTDDDKYLAVIGADLHLGNGSVLRGATLLSRNGKIRRIGHDIYIPENAKVVHAHGFRVYPGMVALSASSRITDGTLSADARDMDSWAGANSADGSAADEVTVEDWVEDWDQDFETTQAFDEAALRASDSYDPFSSFMALTLAAGITSVESANLPLKLRRDKLDDVVMGDGGTVNFSWGSPDARRSTSTDFQKAAAYLREFRAWEAAGDKSVKEPSRRGINSGAIKVLKGEARAKFSADLANDLLGIARLAQTYSFRPIIDGCREGWVVADELGRAGATAIVQPRERRTKDELMVGPAGSSIENAAILHKSGVQVAVKPMNGNVDLSGIAGRDILALSIDAGFAVRGGLSEAAALQAVTIVPARVMGVDHLVGSLEVGKDADFVITDGDLLHYETHVQLAFVLGEVAYDKAEELYYAHIRPRAKIQITDGLKPAEAVEDGAAPADEVPAPAEDPAPEETPSPEEEEPEPKPEDGPKPEDDPKPEDGPKPEVPPSQAA